MKQNRKNTMILFYSAIHGLNHSKGYTLKFILYSLRKPSGRNYKLDKYFKIFHSVFAEDHTKCLNTDVILQQKQNPININIITL